MSLQALTAVFNLDIKPSPMKFVLVCLANYANEQGEAWCSAKTMQGMTCLDIKTVEKWTRQLEVQGFIRDTGDRRGHTKSIKIYQIVSFEAHPNQRHGSSPNAEPKLPQCADGSSPNAEISPCTPYIAKPKEPKKNIKCVLAVWEKNIGCQLCVEQLMGWIKEKGLDPNGVKVAIEEFRDQVTGGGNQYADFTAAFKTYLRKGYLRLKIDQVRLKPTGRNGVTFQDKGNSL